MRAPAASSRCGRCRPDKFVVLGLVASKVAELEPADQLKRRIEEASRYVKLEQLALSPQCGFSTSATEHVGMTEAHGKGQARPHRRGRARGVGRLTRLRPIAWDAS